MTKTIDIARRVQASRGYGAGEGAHVATISASGETFARLPTKVGD